MTHQKLMCLRLKCIKTKVIKNKNQVLVATSREIRLNLKTLKESALGSIKVRIRTI